jgi:ferritin
MTGVLTCTIVICMSDSDLHETKFHALLRDQIRDEFSASQQYIAMATYFDGDDLPQLAALFYRQSVEERNHALMLVRYLLDRGVDVEIPGADSPRTDFTSPRRCADRCRTRRT